MHLAKDSPEIIPEITASAGDPAGGKTAHDKIPLRVLIDARKITDGGIGRYTASLLDALAPEKILITALILPQQRLLLSSAITPLVTHLKPFSLRSFLGLSAQIPWGLFDVYHSPHFLLPRRVPIPSVVTVHDAIPVSHPVNFLHQRVMSYLLARLGRDATKVIAVSKASAARLKELVGCSTEVVENILPFPTEALPAEHALSVQAPYVVGVFSNSKSHKGQEKFAKVCNDCGVHGVAIGHGAALLDGMPNITYLSEMPWEKLLEIYRGAQALLVCSSVEGFCLPAMEAKALGVRVVSTPEPAVLELLDYNDEIAKDFSSEALSLALRHALARPLTGYRWQKGEDLYPQRIAKKILNVYNSVLEYSH